MRRSSACSDQSANMALKRTALGDLPSAKRVRHFENNEPSKNQFHRSQGSDSSPSGKHLSYPEIIDLTADSNETDELVSPRTPRKSFRFLDLPTELRLAVYREILPHNLRISFQKVYRQSRNIVSWHIHLVTKNGEPWSKVCHWKMAAHIPGVDQSLFLINKKTSNEAKGVLYGENTFVFTIDGSAHHPVSLQSPEIFGPLGTSTGLPLLRNLRNVEMLVKVNIASHWASKRHKARLDYFISVLKEHADDESQKSLLWNLKVRYERSSWITPGWMRGSMYGLESFAALRGIKEVELYAEELPQWYRDCLKLCIKGTGKGVEPLDYPDVQIRKKTGVFRTKWKKAWTTTKKWYQPTLNWKEFADRNGIAMPDDSEWLG